ncbi:MAG: hypothetical protein HFG05_01830 [Oscillibacter sp.]|nr:hypothetical protein [Oscillibacter sp.]
MQSEKASKIIAAVKALPDQDADILEAFLAGLRAGKRAGDPELPPPAANSPDPKT